MSRGIGKFHFTIERQSTEMTVTNEGSHKEQKMKNKKRKMGEIKLKLDSPWPSGAMTHINSKKQGLVRLK